MNAKTSLESDVEALAAEVKELRGAIDKIVNLLGQTARDGGDEAYRVARETGERYWEDAKTRADDIVHQIEEKPVQSTLIALGVGLVVGLLFGRH